MVKSISWLDRLYQIGEKESYKESVEISMSSYIQKLKPNPLLLF